MTSADVRPLRRADRDQLTALVNAHAQAVVPGVAVSVNTVLSKLEREPGEFIVDPWITDRATLVAEQRGRISAAAHVVRYGSGPEVGATLRGTGEIHWLLCWPDTPFWPDATHAGTAVTAAAVTVLRRWGVGRTSFAGTLPAPGVYGLPEQWPHIRLLLQQSGFVCGDRSELVFLADVAHLPRGRAPSAGLQLVRTLGSSGTRFTAGRDGRPVGYIEVDTGITGAGRIATQDGWADIGNLHVTDDHRRHGIGTWLLGRAAEWLRLGRVDRLLAYATPEETALLTFLERRGFLRLTQTTREWRLDG